MILTSRHGCDKFLWRDCYDGDGDCVAVEFVVSVAIVMILARVIVVLTVIK